MEETIQAIEEVEVVQPTETPTEPVTPTETQEPVTPTDEPKEELYELPDGRKVDAQTLSKEWKENFYPEFTRKSQELAQVKATTTPEIPTEPKEEWVPQTYEEIIEKAKQEVFKTIEQTERERMEYQQRVEAETSNQLDELKKLDPSLNENALFQHAMKYRNPDGTLVFKDLRVAYQNMKDMNMLAKNVQETTVKNIAKRQDPVSMTPGAGAGKPDPQQFSSAIDYLRSITQ